MKRLLCIAVVTATATSLIADEATDKLRKEFEAYKAASEQRQQFSL